MHIPQSIYITIHTYTPDTIYHIPHATYPQHTWLDDFTRQNGHGKNTLIQLLDMKRAPSQSGHKRNILFVGEMGSRALEVLMILALQHDNNIAWNCIGRLVTFPRKGDLLPMLHALLHKHLQNLFFLTDLSTMTGSAAILVRDDFASTVTVGAGDLGLLDHGAHLADDELDTGAVTGGTGADAAGLATPAVAFFADDVSGEGEFGFLAEVEVLEGDVEGMDHVLALAWALGPSASAAPAAKEAAATAKEGAEEVLWVEPPLHAPTAVQASLPGAIVDTALAVVGEDLVGMADVLELVPSVRVLVWVVLEGQFPVCLFDFPLAGRGCDAQRIVQLCFLDHRVCMRVCVCVCVCVCL